jgi:hypothetical protein
MGAAALAEPPAEVDEEPSTVHAAHAGHGGHAHATKRKGRRRGGSR